MGVYINMEMPNDENDELISALRNNADHYGFVGENGLVHLLTNAADAIEQLSNGGSAYGRGWALGYDAGREENKPRWIPVEERLPEAMQKVLVATYHGGVYFGFMEPRGKFVTANNTLADSWCWEPSVTHWMPLPQTPKEE